MTTSIAPIIRRECYADDAECTHDVGGYGVEVGFHGAETETGYDLGQEVRDAEEGDAGAEADCHVDGPETVLFEDEEGGAEGEC
jgi:hypothetical protein